VRDLLRDDRRLLPERALEITDGVLRALDYSHRNGIVHRDIKPGNVMLTRAGEIKVMDFGIARAVSDAQATMTQTAQVIGTAQYLSPEQARGERVDARSDIYSAGCLFYELLTGRPPFTGDSPVAIAYQHVRENPIPPSRVDPEVPAWADSIVLKAMAKDAAARYQTAGEMRNDIQRALSGMPVAPPTRADYGPTRRMGPAAAGAGPTSAIPAYAYGPPDDQVPDLGPRRRAWPWVVAILAVLLLLAGGIYGYKYIAGTGGNIAVPSVDGLTKKAAETQIRKEHLKVGKVTFANSSTIAKNHVIKTSPPNGQLVAKNSSVALVVSEGQAKVAVPFLVGDKAAVALRALSKAHLSSREIPVNSTQPANLVVKQSPAGGTKVGPNSTVTIYVSSGGNQVPNVIGDTQAQATTRLQNDGFVVTAVTAQPPSGSGVAPGHVFATSPPTGKLEPHGATVTIYIAAAPSTSPSPSATPSPTASPSPSPSSTSPGQ
jgi:serine/threonine-protein kinase